MKINLKRISLLAILSCISSAAWAQCGAGVNTGGGNCTPPDAPGMPGYTDDGAAASPRPQQVAWADRWGAIVISRDTGQAGAAVGKVSKSEAVSAAMKDCEANGASACKLELAYVNQCAAVAWGKKTYSVAHDPSEAGARQVASKTCGGESADCKIVYSACSEATPIQ